MTASIEIHKRFPPQFALDVALSAPPGITILFGASGSGKTTVLRAVSGLTRPDTGRIAVDDRVLFDSTSGIDVPPRSRRVGYVFQESALFPHMSVDANIRYGLHRLPEREVRARVSAIAESFHISGILSRRPKYISGGERQRAALARALVTDPHILLLDEPLSALDHAIQSRIMDDLRAWNEAHRIPILYVTHGHREAFAMGERVVVLDQGRVLASGSPHDVLDHPVDITLANLAGFENVFTAIVVERHEPAGTMQCRLGGSATELEVPLTRAAPGDTVRLAIRAGDIMLASEEPHGLSARNVLPGRIVDLSVRGSTMIAAVDAGARFEVHLTKSAASALSLGAGSPVWLIVKTYSCRIAAS